MKMESELNELKSVLRSLVVSSPTEVDVRTLLRDYRNMMGEPLPLGKFGYRDGLTFIKEKCSDCFVVQESGCNPVLTLIVPDSVKHIDKFVQKQKVTSRFKGKRRSVPEAAFKNSDLIVKTYRVEVENCNKTDYTVVPEDKELLNISSYSSNHAVRDNNSDKLTNGVCGSGARSDGVCCSNALQNFMKKRVSILNSCQDPDTEICLDRDSSKGDTDSGRLTLSSNSSGKRAQLEELKMEIRELIAEVPEGVWCTELMRLYREKYGRELNFSRFGFTSVLSLAYAVDDLQYYVAEHTGELLLLLQPAAASTSPGRATRPELSAHQAHPALPARPARLARPALPAHPTGDPEDALPGIDFDEDVFPRDCMHIMQSVPAQSLDELVPGAMLEVVLGEVYSPTHFWLLRLGPAHYSAMESLMDDMNTYYRGEGRERALAGGAVRVGHYCACCYHGDWHRAVVVKVLDSDTVKVRHIDYATVETVETRSLKPLLRRWGALPAQALRARLAGARPPAAGRRWPWAAAAHFLALVKERRLVANVVAKDAQEGILEVLLIDTSTEEDVCISTEMCRSGHADPRPDSALGTSECYLYPRFDALETGDTPNYAEIYCYLRDGISLEFVEDYRRHVPPCLPPPEPPEPVALPAPRELSPALLAEASPPCRSPTPSPSMGPVRRAERAASLGPSHETDSGLRSGAVVNRIPLLRPEPSYTPPPQSSRSLPAGGFPAPAYSLWHLSPFAPPFYPQQSILGPYPIFSSEGAQFHPSPGLERLHIPGAPSGVSVPASECEIFAILSRVDPAAAHRYMVDALSRAVAGTRLTTAAPAPVLTSRAATTAAAATRPPPGFERAVRPAHPAP